MQLLMAVVTQYHFARGLSGTDGSVQKVLLILGHQRTNRPLRRRNSREILLMDTKQNVLTRPKILTL